MIIAEKNNSESFACPAFVTGVVGFPMHACAYIMITAARVYETRSENIKRVQFCLFDDYGFKCFLDKLNKNKDKVSRSIKDFLKQSSSVEFRDYKNKDIHDRYIISESELVLLGHGIKDLGSKESFAIIFSRKSATNVYESLVEAFNRRWKLATTIR